MVVSDVKSRPDAPSNKTCVGTLVAPKAVLTASHCLGSPAPADLRVTIGRDDLRGTAGRVVPVASTWVNPTFREGLARESFFGGVLHPVDIASADIGLVTLAEPVDGPFLPLAGPGDQLTGQAATVYGWRMHPDDQPVLWQAPTKVGEDAECVRRAADSVSYLPPRWHGIRYDTSAYLCVGTEQAIRLRATDSGSPVVVGGKVAGVAAWFPSAETAAPDYYTRVSAHHAELVNRINAIS